MHCHQTPSQLSGSPRNSALFHQKSSLLCEPSHIRSHSTANTSLATRTVRCRPNKGSVKSHTKSIPAVLNRLSWSAGWCCFSYLPPSYPPERSIGIVTLTPPSQGTPRRPPLLRGGRNLCLRAKGISAKLPEMRSAEQMALVGEGVVSGGMDREKALS